MINKILNAIKSFLAIYGIFLTMYCLFDLDSADVLKLMLKSAIVAFAITLLVELSKWLKKRRKDSKDYDDYITI